MMQSIQGVSVQLVHKQACQVIVKRGVRANEYFAYCGEVGCDVWAQLLNLKFRVGEPLCLWLPERFKKPDTSTYVQGVEVPVDFSGCIPDGFDKIELPAASYLKFQGEPFLNENFMEAIQHVQQVMEQYDPACGGLVWDDQNPGIQYEPRGERGYIELRAVKKIQ